MNDDRYVAAIEVSSSKIVAVVGKTHPDGHLDIIASEQERGVEGVKYGIIQNLEETSMRIARIIERLERKPAVAPRRITGVFVGLSGRSVRSISTEVHLNLPDETEITDDILERLRSQALATAIDNSLEVVDAIPRLYTVGTTETATPKGTIGNSISATFDLIVCRPELRRNLTRTITEKNGLDIEGFVVTALATAQVILTSEEKRLGCMLVDMGAETTTVSIYKRGHLNYFATLPLGGRNITRDITSLSGVLEERAEDIKITSGNALPREASSTLSISGIRMSDVSNLIVARAEEIVANIVEQINYAKLDESMLPGGIICIGGAAKLNGMLDLLGTKTGLPVKRGQLPSYIHMEEVKAPLSELLEVSSVLYAGAMDSDAECLESPDRESLPGGGIPNETGRHGNDTEEDDERKQKPGKRSRFFGKLGEKLAGMFSGSEEDDSDLL